MTKQEFPIRPAAGAERLSHLAAGLLLLMYIVAVAVLIVDAANMEASL